VKPRKLIFQVHLWLGLSVGLYLAVMGATGSLLVFAEPVDRWLNPHLRAIDAKAPRQPFATALAGFRDHYPDSEISRIRVPAEPDRPVAFWVGGWSASLKQIYVHPGTGEVTGERYLLGSVTGFTRYLHFNLIGGGLGWLINGWLALASLAVLLTGLWLWWPRSLRQLKQRLWVKWSAPTFRVNWDLHNAFGAWTLLPLLVITLTGAAFVFHGTTKALIGQFASFSSPRELSASAASEGEGTDKPVKSLDRLVDAAERAIPESEVFEVRWDRRSGEPLTAYAWPKGAEPWNQWARVRVDARSAEVLSVSQKKTAGDRVLAGILPIHAGTFGGLIVKWLYFAFGLIPSLLLATGLIMYLKRLRTKRRRSRRLRKQTSSSVAVDGSVMPQR